MQIGFITILNLSMPMKIDELKKIATRDPYYHGIGCIRLPIGNRQLYSFYSKKLTQPISNYIHSHQHDLYCESIHGRYKNTIYDFTITNDYSDYCMQKIVCKDNADPEMLYENVIPHQKHESLLLKNMTHTHSGLHIVEPIDDVVITKVTRGDKFYPIARIIRNKNEQYVCGLSQRGTPEDNWEIIREILNEI